MSKGSQDPWNKMVMFPGFYLCLTYPRPGAKEGGNLEMSMDTDKNKTKQNKTKQNKTTKEAQKPASSSQRTRKGSLTRSKIFRQ